MQSVHKKSIHNLICNKTTSYGYYYNVKYFCNKNNIYNNNNNNNNDFDWYCKKTWKEASINTSWCLLGCSIGDFGTMIIGNIFFPTFVVLNPLPIMTIATLNGLATSIMLETFILYQRNKINGMKLSQCLSTALGMSLISMISMETAMNITDYLIVGTANVTIYSVIPSLIAGFIVPLPYNYWRLKKFGKACH